MFGFGKKNKDADALKIKELQRQIDGYEYAKNTLTSRLKELEKESSKLKSDNRELTTENGELSRELAGYKKKSEVTLKSAKLSKGAKNEFAEFEAQAKSMSDSQRMYAALTVAKKVGGRPYTAEAKTVGEMKEIIKQVRQGKLVVVGK